MQGNKIKKIRNHCEFFWLEAKGFSNLRLQNRGRPRTLHTSPLPSHWVTQGSSLNFGFIIGNNTLLRSRIQTNTGEYMRIDECKKLRKRLRITVLLGGAKQESAWLFVPCLSGHSSHVTLRNAQRDYAADSNKQNCFSTSFAGHGKRL